MSETPTAGRVDSFELDELTAALSDLELEPLDVRAAGFVRLHDQLAERLSSGSDPTAIA